MNVIIDSNIFVMCMNPLSDYYVIFKKLVNGDYTLFVSTDIVFEYMEVFERKFNETKSNLLYRFLIESNNVRFVEVYFKWKLIPADPDDNKYSDCYIAADADYLVTNDRHFDVLKQTAFPKISILNINEFVKLIS
jgi:predicted nucleic acid-binding protein